MEEEISIRNILVKAQLEIMNISFSNLQKQVYKYPTWVPVDIDIKRKNDRLNESSEPEIKDGWVVHNGSKFVHVDPPPFVYDACTDSYTVVNRPLALQILGIKE